MVTPGPGLPGAVAPVPTGWRSRLASPAVVLLLLLVALAVLAPLIAPYPADGGSATHPDQALEGISSAHWLGTDEVGRDTLTRVLYGLRTSLFIVICVLTLSAIIGVTVGAIAGYAGGWVESVLMRITDVFLAFPALLLALTLAVVLGAGLQTAIFAIAVTWWPWYARLTTGLASSIRRRGYVDAARCLGVGHTRIVVRHVLPNAVSPVVVQLSLDSGGVILTAAALSFLGLGAMEPTAELGLMVSQGQAVFATNPLVALAPGIAILVVALAFNLLGERLRVRLNPMERE